MSQHHLGRRRLTALALSAPLALALPGTALAAHGAPDPRGAGQGVGPAAGQGQRPDTSTATIGGGNRNERVTICHATGSASNPYVLIRPNANAVVAAHAGHQDGRDVIPPFTYADHGQTRTFPGQNTDAAGTALLAAGCVVPGSDGSATPGRDPRNRERVTICHATGSLTNPYVVITPSKRGVLAGHVGEDHQDGRDVIPSFTYVDRDGALQTFAGQNLDRAGLLSTGCVVPAVVPDVVVPVVVVPVVVPVVVVPVVVVPSDTGTVDVPPAPPGVTDGSAQPVVLSPQSPPVFGPPTGLPTGVPATGTPGTPLAGLPLGQPATRPVEQPVSGTSAEEGVRAPELTGGAVLASAADRPRALPFTGGETALLLQVAAGLLVSGVATVRLTRRRPLAG